MTLGKHPDHLSVSRLTISKSGTQKMRGETAITRVLPFYLQFLTLKSRNPISQARKDILIPLKYFTMRKEFEHDVLSTRHSLARFL